MTRSTLFAHLHRTRRDRPEPLRVLVVHDGPPARKRVERMLRRMRRRLGAGLQMARAYQRLHEMWCADGSSTPQRIELLFLAASCCATLPREVLATVTSLLPSLKENRGAVAFLSGTHVPRRMDVLLVEHLLRTHSERAGVPFFAGFMPGLGCPLCGLAKGNKRGSSGATCVLHAPRIVETSRHPLFPHGSKMAKTKL